MGKDQAHLYHSRKISYTWVMTLEQASLMQLMLSYGFKTPAELSAVHHDDVSGGRDSEENWELHLTIFSYI